MSFSMILSPIQTRFTPLPIKRSVQFTNKPISQLQVNAPTFGHVTDTVTGYDADAVKHFESVHASSVLANFTHPYYAQINPLPLKILQFHTHFDRTVRQMALDADTPQAFQKELRKIEAAYRQLTPHQREAISEYAKIVDQNPLNQLVVEADLVKLGMYTLEKGKSMMVGREPEKVTHVIPHNFTSGTHALIYRTPDGLRVSDQSSTHGTFLNEEKQEGAFNLRKDGEILKLLIFPLELTIDSDVANWNLPHWNQAASPPNGT